MIPFAPKDDADIVSFDENGQEYIFDGQEAQDKREVRGDESAGEPIEPNRPANAMKQSLSHV